MKSLKTALFAIASAGIINTSAMAQSATFETEDNTAEDDSGFFIALGVSRIQVDASAEFNDAKLDFDDSDNAYNFRAGYMFTNWIGVEAAYYDFGEFEDSLEDAAEDLGVSNADIDLDLKGYGISLIGNIPLPYFDLYLKGGVVELDGEATASAFGLSISEERDSTEPFAAVGAEFDLGTVNLFAEYSRILDNDDVEVDFATVGIKLEL